MAGRTLRQAVRAFVDPLQLAISCVSKAVLTYSGGDYPRDEPHVLTLGAPVMLIGTARLSLAVTMWYRFVQATDRGAPWAVDVVGYLYALKDAAGQEILSYQWHPAGRSHVTTPHLHLGAGALVGRREVAGAHLPTGRVALQDVLRLAISEFGVTPLRRDWESVLARTQRAPDIS